MDFDDPEARRHGRKRSVTVHQRGGIEKKSKAVRWSNNKKSHLIDEYEACPRPWDAFSDQARARLLARTAGKLLSIIAKFFEPFSRE